ncbi:oxysterol-binding protein 2 [Platysternon megacephalum]|uniref:Oxysterol-binding protein 2 n=1 Tax=Platysternon megacephalum TaxID=55544 RepID=A0A4D9DPS9_9SAUR|nr:oxysterol-binding protein 2 [Platysternon megacephalum]
MCLSLSQKQMKYLEQQQEETKGAKEEARRLRNKLKTMESPAPVELLSPKLHRPAHSNEVDLDATFDVETPEHQPHKSITTPAKKSKLDKKPPPVTNLEKKVLKETVENWAGEPEDDPLEEFFPAFIRNSVLSRKPPVGSLLGPHKNTGAVRMGYDGLGGRTKFIQPTNPMEIRPLAVKSRKRNVSRPASTTAAAASSSGTSQAKLDSFLQ